MQKLFTLLLGACALSLALFAIPVQAQTAAGKIDGQIMNGTKDAKAASLQNLTVHLFGMAPGMPQPISTTAQSDATGKFSFLNLSADPATKYLLTTQYGGLDYATDPISFEANQTTLPATLKVYETTTDASVVKVSQTHLILDIQNRAFNVIQIVIALNSSDRSLVRGTNNATLLLPVPSGAQNIQFESADADQSTLRGDGVMTYTLSIPPGSNQIVYSYALPVTPPSYKFILKMPYDCPVVRLLSADVGETITSRELPTQSPFSAQNGQKFLLNVASNVRAGTVLSADFANLSATNVSPATSSSSTSPSARPANQNELLYAQIIGGISVLAFVGLLVFAVMRKRKDA